MTKNMMMRSSPNMKYDDGQDLAVDKSHWVANGVGEVGPHLRLRIIDNKN